MKNFIIARKNCDSANPGDRAAIIFEADDVAALKKGMVFKTMKSEGENSIEK